MIAALFYLHTRSVKNRLVSRFKRLKQPKYLLGALVGGLYFYFYFFRILFIGQSPASRRALTPGGALPELLTGLEWLGALVLFVFIALAWLLPKERAALEFTEAEVAFLFPAPVTRKTLIHFKLIRSQIRILFSAFFFTLISRRFAAGGHAWMHALGWWVILSTMNLHFLGSSFVRTLLVDRGITTWKRRGMVAAGLGVLGIAIYVWGRNTLRAPGPADLESLRAAGNYLKSLLESGPMLVVLYPFRLVVRPFLSSDLATLAAALAPALLLLALHYWWVMKLDVSFEEASLAASQKRATMIAAMRSGNAQLLRPAKKRKKPLFRLSASGLRVMALFWKNVIVADQTFNLRFWGMTLLAVAGICVVMGSRAGVWEALPPMAAMLAVGGYGYSLLLGPQILRQDLRQDLVVADMLKVYPLAGWQIVLGELLAPAVILTAVQWSMLLLALIFSNHLPGNVEFPAGQRIAAFLGLGMISPALNFLWLLIPNAAVLYFPGWFRTGTEIPHGMEVMGQRLIMMLGQGLMLLVSVLPAAGAFALSFFLIKALANLEAAILAGALFGTVVLVVEAAAGIVVLGKLFERLDLSAEGPA